MPPSGSRKAPVLPVRPASTASSSADEVVEIPVLLRAPTSLIPTTNKRRTNIDRSHIEWSCIQITSGGDTHSPVGPRTFCGKSQCWTAARIKDHMLGMNGSKACPSQTDAFFKKKEIIAGLRMESAAKKAKQGSVASSNKVSEKAASPAAVWRQQGIQACVTSAQGSAIDDAVATLIYAENLSARIVGSRHFAALVRLLSCAPPSYKLPHRNRISGDLLDAATQRLRALDEPMREALLKGQGCTVMCD